MNLTVVCFQKKLNFPGLQKMPILYCAHRIKAYSRTACNSMWPPYKFYKHFFVLNRPYPDIAGELHERQDTFRSFCNSLDLTVSCYNRLKSGTAAVEFNLIKEELLEMDQELEKAENEFNWNSEGIWEYIEKLRITLMDLDSRVKKTQFNVDVISKLMQTWKNTPMFTRKETESKVNLLDIAGMEAVKKQRYTEFTEASNKIGALMQECKELFR